ncbi:VirB4 family type IV secretion system protein [Streptacidiphilus albus]|uniref:VirB4 family type IV secretion system protein n=1 Tax=Streptacidiphilus albus TaxID=105425 RepID=UPI000A987C5A|nr:ATP-binding protein [Streptacidiphilus albus]
MLNHLFRSPDERAPSGFEADPQPGSGTGLGPDSVQVEPRCLAVGDLLAATLVVTGYPAEVAPGWLDPLLCYPGRLDVSLHVEPVAPVVAADRLRKQRARLESARRTGYQRGRLEDPETEAAAGDAAELAWRLARGEGRLFRVGLYLTVYAPDREALADEVSAVRAVAESLLLRVQPATWRALAGWTSCLPLGVDRLGRTRTFDTAALAAAFPFSSPDLAPPPGRPTSTPTGVLYGVNTTASGLLFWDRWTQDNHNSVTLARSGAGKSYLTKLDVLRSLYQGVEVHVVDPEDEYTALADAVGGTVVRLGEPGMRLNPLDLDPDGGADELTRRMLFAHTLLSVLLREPMAPDERAALDRALLATYSDAGITPVPRSHARPAPLLADLATALTASEDPVATRLGDRLTPFTTGSHRQLFDGPTTTAPGGHLTVYSTRHLPDELTATGVLLALDRIWRAVTDTRRLRRRLVVVDEAWLLMREEEGARFCHRMAKSARKHRAGLAVVTQDTADLLSTDLGRAVVANAATQILMHQAPQAIDAVADTFHLSAGEAAHLLTAQRGEALLCAGPGRRAAFCVTASAGEDALCRTGIEADQAAAAR